MPNGKMPRQKQRWDHSRFFKYYGNSALMAEFAPFGQGSQTFKSLQRKRLDNLASYCAQRPPQESPFPVNNYSGTNITSFWYFYKKYNFLACILPKVGQNRQLWTAWNADFEQLWRPQGSKLNLD